MGYRTYSIVVHLVRGAGGARSDATTTTTTTTTWIASERSREVTHTHRCLGKIKLHRSCVFHTIHTLRCGYMWGAVLRGTWWAIHIRSALIVWRSRLSATLLAS